MNQEEEVKIPDQQVEPVIEPALEPKKHWKKILLIAFIALIWVTGVSFGIYQFLIKPSKIPTWHDLKVGTSTKEMVIKELGEPMRIEELPYSTAFIYPSDYEVFPNVIIFDEEGKIKTMFVSVPINEPVKLSDWIKTYGIPEKEMYNSISGDTKTYIFAKRGVAVVANKEADGVYQIQYFEPTTVEQYLKNWGQNLLEKSPYRY